MIITRELAERKIKRVIAVAKNDPSEYNDGFVTGTIMAYYEQGLFTENEVNQTLTDYGFDPIDFDEEG